MCGAGKRAKYSLSRVFEFFTFLLINIALHHICLLSLLFYCFYIKHVWLNGM